MALCRHILALSILLVAFSIKAAEPEYAWEAENGEIPCSIVASREKLELGTDDSAVLSIVSAKAIKDISISTNYGSIVQTGRTAPNRFEARYIVPPSRFPRIAIISAVGHTADSMLAQCWIALSLWGQGEAVFKTKSNERIDNIRIGERFFGPVVANSEGIATLKIVVPPGNNRAFYDDSSIDFGLPDTAHLHIAVDTIATKAGNELSRAVFVYAVTPEGRPRIGAPVELWASKGSLAVLVSSGPGVSRARWAVKPVDGEKAVLSARLKDEPSFVREAKLVIERSDGSQFPDSANWESVRK